MKRWLLSATFVGLVAVCGNGLAQEEKDTPSQKTREALEKFRKAPAAVGKSLEALKEAARGKLGESPGAGQTAQPEPDPFALPAKKAEPVGAPRYSPVGKRDPFQPLPLKVKATRRPRENLSPLERYELGQLQLVGIVWDAKEPRAMVEDAAGLGYIVKVGTPIGPNEGKIKAIRPTEVVVEESYIDFYGARKNRQVTMKLIAE